MKNTFLNLHDITENLKPLANSDCYYPGFEKLACYFIYREAAPKLVEMMLRGISAPRVSLSGGYDIPDKPGCWWKYLRCSGVKGAVCISFQNLDIDRGFVRILGVEECPNN